MGPRWIEASAAQGPRSAERGIGRHIVETLRAMHRIDPGAVGSVRLDPGLPVPPALEFLARTGSLGEGLAYPGRDEEIPSIFHLTAPFEQVPVDRMLPPWIRRHRDRIRLVVTLYDLIPLALPELYLPDSNLGWATTYRARLGLLHEADRILAISDATAADAVDLLGIDPGRITMVSSGVSDDFSSLVGSREEAREVLADSGSPPREGFLLYVGGGDPRKNMRGTIEAFAKVPPELRSRHQLVIVCRLGPQVTGELRVYARSLGIRDRDLLFAGFVEDRELAAMYRLCGLFIFPSLYEGFGLPVLEAMSCGAPVAASNNSSIPEVLGDLEGTFDPADPADIAGTLTRILQSPELLERLRERSARRPPLFGWERCAEATIAGYELASAPEGRRAAAPSQPGRPRVGLVAPWPPAAGPAAELAAALAPELADAVDVDVLVANSEGTFDRSLEPRIRLWAADEIGWVLALREYEGFVYVVDGSEPSAAIRAAAAERPGIVIDCAGEGPAAGGYAELVERIAASVEPVAASAAS